MWTDAENDSAIKMLAVVCEVTGTTVSDAAARLMVEELGTYPCAQVLGALRRCAKECKFKLTLADVIDRLDDGRPGAEEAWALFPKTEEEAAVVTSEMSVAWGVAAALFRNDESIPARMAFKETYERQVREARAAGLAPKWSLSPGSSKALTEVAALDGVKRGLLDAQHTARNFLGPEKREELLLSLPGRKALPQ